MNGRLAGLLVIALAGCFLYLYDTGKWAAFTSVVLSGQLPASTASGTPSSLSTIASGAASVANPLNGSFGIVPIIGNGTGK